MAIPSANASVRRLWTGSGQKNPGIRAGAFLSILDVSGPDQLVSHTLIVFMPLSASVRLLKAIGPTWTMVVVVGFLSTMVQRLVVLSWCRRLWWSSWSRFAPRQAASAWPARRPQ
jgi:hypothetical protein